MPISRFCLQWDNHPKNLSSNLKKLYENQHCIDLKLLCETHSIGVHKCVLAACSPYFADRFIKSADIVSVIMKGIDYPVMKSILEFMYTGETNVIEEYVDAVVETAKFFKVRGLSGIVTEKIGVSEKIRGTKKIEDPEFITKNHIVVDFTKNKLNDYNLNNTNVNNYEKTVEELLLLDVTRSDFTEQSSPVQSDHSVKSILEQSETQLVLNNCNFNETGCSKLVNSGVKIISDVNYSSYLNKKQNIVEESTSPCTDSSCVKEGNEIQNCSRVLNIKNNAAFVKSNEIVPEVSEILSSAVSLVDIASEVMTCNEPTEADKSDDEEPTDVVSNEMIDSSSFDQDESQSIAKSNKVVRLLQDAGMPTDVPVFYEDKNGRYVQLSEKILNDIARGYQVIYQIIDEEGNPSELMLGNMNKQILESQQQESTRVDYDKLVADVVATSESDETSLDIKDHLRIEESIVAANEFLIRNDSQDEQMGFLVTTSDIVENDKVMFQEAEEMSLGENSPIISGEIEMIKKDILLDECQNIVEENDQIISEETKLLEICTNESIDESYSLKSKPLSILLTASNIIENKQVVMEESDKISLNDNCNIVFMEHVDLHSKESDVLENNQKVCSEKSIDFNETHLDKKSDYEDSDNETDLTSFKKSAEITTVSEIYKSECTENTESDMQSSPEKLDSYRISLLSRKKKDTSSFSSSKSTDDTSDSRSESESQIVMYDSQKSNISQKNNCSAEVTSCMETSDNYVSSVDPSKDSSTSLSSSTSASETEKTPVKSPLSKSFNVDTNDCIDSSLISIHKTISTLNSVDYISILGLDKNLLTPSSTIETSDSSMTPTESHSNILENYLCNQPKEENLTNKSLNENPSSILVSNVSIKENIEDPPLTLSDETNVNSIQEDCRNGNQESVEQKMARLHMEIAVSDSSPNNLFEEIQKIKNSRKRSISENRNPFSDSDVSESSTQLTEENDKSVQSVSKYNKYLQISHSKRKRTMQEGNERKETSLDNTNTLCEGIQRLKQSQTNIISEDQKVTSESQLPKMPLKFEKYNLKTETKSKYDNYLKVSHSGKQAKNRQENLINSMETNVENSANIKGQSINLRNLNSNKSSNIRSVRKSNLMHVKRSRLRNSSSSASDNSMHNTGKEIPYALGLLPLNKALKKIQNMPEHKPRKTRSGLKLTKLKTIHSDEDTKQKLSSKLLCSSKMKLNVHRERIIKKTK